MKIVLLFIIQFRKGIVIIIIIKYINYNIIKDYYMIIPNGIEIKISIFYKPKLN